MSRNCRDTNVITGTNYNSVFNQESALRSLLAHSIALCLLALTL